MNMATPNHTSTDHLDDEQAWQALIHRDESFAPGFVTAVRTTGIYCRVTCPARRPRRENVRFYRTPGEAARAGFRACKRCRPDEADPSTISFAVVDCVLGKLLVARTERGICAIKLGDSESALEESLRRDFPLAKIEAAPAQLAGVNRRVAAVAAGADSGTDLPLDVRATDFQWRVWRALRQIPIGQTRTYGEIAEAIGKPRAVRAVGRACASNPVALLIPCHRVVRAGGSQGCYRWGASRKGALLAREAESVGSDLRLAVAS
jgi:AraC family transcriptional regulator of adaptative response/methylated-DNA-[protein]-cysteine methyltransferase